MAELNARSREAARRPLLRSDRARARGAGRLIVRAAQVFWRVLVLLCPEPGEGEEAAQHEEGRVSSDVERRSAILDDVGTNSAGVVSGSDDHDCLEAQTQQLLDKTLSAL
ncbi:hypothetical protein CYMTET_33809 [Cymbomonas tetramitiformis]|uniref:Uncharacterized protein n=1 Tax=Cymbomonas tetramitiformis TaxID=36881 RepID=A0AAE0FC89_9CHLO|nr:hypothetical protein CYMTET_33809 [Cymbomonas tetramitiformis]